MGNCPLTMKERLRTKLRGKCVFSCDGCHYRSWVGSFVENGKDFYHIYREDKEYVYLMHNSGKTFRIKKDKLELIEE